MFPVKIGRPATAIKTSYSILRHDQRGALHYALIERSRRGQVSDVCLIVVVSGEMVRPNGSIRLLAAWSSAKRGFSVKASNPEAWYGPARLAEAEAAYQTAVRRLMAPSPKLQARPRKRRK